MGILFVIAFFVPSSWALIALIRRLRRQRAGTCQWLAFGVLFACGLALGIGCGFYCEYQVGRTIRIFSFPIPVVFFHLEDGNWVDFPVPEFQAWASVFANIITIASVATLPLWVVSWQRNEHES
jgi:hypothetical protein